MGLASARDMMTALTGSIVARVGQELSGPRRQRLAERRSLASKLSRDPKPPTTGVA